MYGDDGLQKPGCFSSYLQFFLCLNVFSLCLSLSFLSSLIDVCHFSHYSFLASFYVNPLIFGSPYYKMHVLLFLWSRDLGESIMSILTLKGVNWEKGKGWKEQTKELYMSYSVLLFIVHPQWEESRIFIWSDSQDSRAPLWIDGRVTQVPQTSNPGC